MEPELHPDLLPVSFLVGTWLGHGTGEYPTIKPFRYNEEVRFWHVGKAFLAYEQRTWAPDTGRPMHSEMGYWRCNSDGDLQVVLTHPTGVVEVSEGTVRGAAIEFATTHIALVPGAKDVEKLQRSFLIAGDLLTYEVRMAAVGEPLQHHLAAELNRVPPREVAVEVAEETLT
ncbi:MAG TPA: FABP family protein [Actinomycetota bacterium]|nr:FABP family protein [Actinomycetota bacterium]